MNDNLSIKSLVDRGGNLPHIVTERIWRSMMRDWNEPRCERKYCFDLKEPIQYKWSGKFIALNQDWIHIDRQLIDYELFVIEKGTLYIEDEWGKYAVKDGQYILMGPTVRQRGYQPSKCRYYWMHFLAKEIEPMPDEELKLRDTISSERGSERLVLLKHGTLANAERLYILIKQLQDADLRYLNGDYNSYLATSVLYEIALQTIRADLKPETVKGEELKQQVEEFLLGHMAENLSVGTIARHFGYHGKYFCALFKEKTGYSVKQFIDERKMERAKYYLLNSNAWVIDIAEHLGYSNIQNFYHVFRKYANCTPSEYRETYNKKKEVRE